MTDATVGMRIGDIPPIYVRLRPVSTNPERIMSTSVPLNNQLLPLMRSANSIFVRVESEFSPREEADFQPTKQTVLTQFKSECVH